MMEQNSGLTCWASTLLSGCVLASSTGYQQAAQGRKNTVCKGSPPSMFSKVGNSRSGRTAVVPRLLWTQIQLRVGGRRVLGLHFPSKHLLLSRKGKLSPGQGQDLAWFRVTICGKECPGRKLTEPLWPI